MNPPDFLISQSVKDFSGNRWKTPLNLAVVLHILVFATGMIMPSIFLSRPKIPEFYTVDLLNVTELAEQMTPAKPPPMQAIKPAPPSKPDIVEKSTKAVSENISTTEPAVPDAKPVSLRPVKRKIKKAQAKSEVDFEKTKRALARERKRAEQQLKRSKEIATKSAQDAVARLRDSIHAASSIPAATTTKETSSGPRGPVGAGVEMDEVMKRYYAAVYQQIQNNWFLPPFQNWDDSLEAILVIKIRKDGNVSKSYFEKKSSNVYFNQFLMKTIQEAGAMPKFPEDLKESQLEIGLRFTPSGVY